MGYLTRAVFYVFLGSLVWFGCDTMPGTEDVDAVAPILQSRNELIAPQVIDSDLIEVTAGTLSSEITISVSASDGDGDLAMLYAVIQDPAAGGSKIGSSEMSLPGNGNYILKMPVDFPEGSIGSYQVVVFASDTGGRMSNRLIGQVEIVAGSLPPVIGSIDIPSSITRPASGQPPILIPIVVSVSDPDGAANVLGVDIVVNGGSTLKACDDGGQLVCNVGFGSSGDATAGDGKYTLTIQLNSDNAAADYQFDFTAIDRSGLRSETITRIMTVN